MTPRQNCNFSQHNFFALFPEEYWAQRKPNQIYIGHVK